MQKTITDKILTLNLDEYLTIKGWLSLPQEYETLGVSTDWNNKEQPYKALSDKIKELLKNKNISEESLESVINVKVIPNHNQTSIYYLINATAIIKK